MNDSGVIEVEGVFVVHWEVPRFVVSHAEPHRIEKWQALFDEGVVPRPPAPVRSAGPRFFQMRARGRLGPRGHYGHLGVCSRRFFVSEVLVCEETTDPGTTW